MPTTVYYSTVSGGSLSDAAHRLLQTICGFSARILREAHGKPYFPDHPDCHFSLSHTRGMVVCALSNTRVGVDVERPRIIRPALARRCFGEAELVWAQADKQRFLALWTRKEAVLKCSGEGITRPLREIPVLDRADLQTVWVEGFVISVCAEGLEERLSLTAISL